MIHSIAYIHAALKAICVSLTTNGYSCTSRICCPQVAIENPLKRNSSVTFKGQIPTGVVAFQEYLSIIFGCYIRPYFWRD